MISVILFEKPITLIGAAALSVEIKVKFLTDLPSELTTLMVPNILLCKHSWMLFSDSSTCLCAAA